MVSEMQATPKTNNSRGIPPRVIQLVHSLTAKAASCCRMARDCQVEENIHWFRGSARAYAVAARLVAKEVK